jgi:hypothetical protein
VVADPVEDRLPPFAEIHLCGYPDRPVLFEHELHRDDRLSRAAIADLADRLPVDEVVYEQATKPLLVPSEGPPRGKLERPGDVIRTLDTADAWMGLMDAENDPAIADLTFSTLDQLQPGIMATQGKVRNRGAFFFIGSPNSTTPAHFDIEYNFLFHVEGTKTISFGSFESDEIRRSEVNRYWTGSHGRVEDLPREEYSFDLEPGLGCYIPPLMPHWVLNGPNPSISLTLSFHTAASTRNRRIEDFNSLARKLHLNPREPGGSAIVDSAKIGAIAVWAAGRRLRGAPRALGAK